MLSLQPGSPGCPRGPVSLRTCRPEGQEVVATSETGTLGPVTGQCSDFSQVSSITGPEDRTRLSPATVWHLGTAGEMAAPAG